MLPAVLIDSASSGGVYSLTILYSTDLRFFFHDAMNMHWARLNVREYFHL